MKRLIIAAILVFGFATPALAGHCPKDIRKVSAALQDQDNARARNLRDKGQSLHKAGKHKESLTALHQAMRILGIEH